MSFSAYVFFIQSPDGGSWKRLCEAVRHLSKKSTCYIVSYGGNCPEDIRANKNVNNIGMNLPNKLKNTVSYSILSLFPLLKVLIKEKGKKVWVGSFSANAGFAVSLLSLVVDYKVFCVRRGANLRRRKIRNKKSKNNKRIDRIKNYISIKIHKAIAKVMLNSADILISQTQNGLKQLQMEYSGHIPTRCYVLRNNLNATWIEDKKKRAIENPTNMEDKKFNVCFVGRMEMVGKGVDSLLKAANVINKSNVNFHLIGDGVDLQDVRRYVENKNMEKFVKIYGWMDNPLRAMVSSDLTVVPSRVDPCPNVVLESLAVGTPVIGANNGGIKAMLSNEELLFDPNNPKEIANKICSIASDEEYLSYIEDICLSRRDVHKFDWGYEFEKILANYNATGNTCKTVNE